ncbi:efflux RND transporter periplasmic adaptor subunit [bacterium]|nr:efflux RND transporter periplasmic adaptor subunit [bacterium]
MTKKRIVIIAIIVVAFLLCAFGVYKFIKMKSAAKRAGNAPQVIIEPVQEEEITWTFDAPGRIVSKYQVNVLARINGYLQKSYFKEGDFVKTGQVLFQIEPEEFSNAADVAKANVQNIQARLTYAQNQLKRAEELVKNDYISKSQYEAMLAERDSLMAQLASAKATNSDTRRNLSYTEVKSPVDGRVGLITVTLGNYVTPSSGPLTTINSMNPIYVTFPMGTADFATLMMTDKGNEQNRKVELYFGNGVKYELDGVQDFHDNKVDETTGTVTMRATFENPRNILLHGEFVNVKLYSNNKIKVPVVSQVAVQENQAGKYVYTVNDDNVAALTYIKTGEQTGDNWIIKEGLKAGDRVITDGFMKVVPGSKVKEITPEEKAHMTETSETRENKRGEK